ncbi:MAG: methyltransferase domain-containing protein, partial [Deltaproteobacteria bacterium]|nr:methyltransferase domain-containing protein [Deltaproteobacteria bacterium]
KLYSSEFGLSTTKSWVHVNTFLKDALREKILSFNPFVRAPYKGRGEFLKTDRLTELWIHTNNSCNLQCSHCLVSSGPREDKGLPTDDIVRIIGEGRELGVFRFYFTGGEPFVRSDIFDLIECVTRDEFSELIILTNGMFFNWKNNINRLLETGRGRLKPQISLDGSNAGTNDPIRGQGTFEKITKGIKAAVQAGLNPTVTTVVNSHNAKDVPEITRLLVSLGVKNHHLLWVHQTGRIMNGGRNLILPTYELIDVVKRVKKTADELGITIDNFETIKGKLKTKKFTKFDLSNSCWDSLCVYSDGEVYPSAALANTRELSSGNIRERSLKEIWNESEVFEKFRGATVQNRSKCSNCFLKFICGGGDIEHSYFYNRATFGKGDLTGLDPYSDLHEFMIVSTLFELAEEKAIQQNNKSGFDSPHVFLAMGEGAVSCGVNETNGNGIRNGKPRSISDLTIELSHSNCVLTFDIDKSREVVREFYGKAAEQPQEELCCPTSYPAEDISHIPKDVIERFYGCGSPISIAEIKPGEAVVDLGSGAGIDCFIAAKKVGKDGRVIGIDMTDQMLGIANECKSTVAKNLGYNVVEFKKGFLEEIPVENKTVDLITSNCVINLSPDKKSVFSEMWRILKNHGRIVISDIVSEREVPEHIVTNDHLWGECIAGSLTEEQFLSYLEQAGFYGLQVLNKAYWKNVENCRFYSITVRGYKFEKSAGCVYIGQKAVYLGPLKAIADEEGHFFPRNEAVEICTDTAEKLTKPPYTGMFIITDPTREANEDYRCCVDGANCC